MDSRPSFHHKRVPARVRRKASYPIGHRSLESFGQNLLFVAQASVPSFLLLIIRLTLTQEFQRNLVL
jgi:hypothetical protein